MADEGNDSREMPAEAEGPPEVTQPLETKRKNAGWPAFTWNYPEHPELERLVGLFVDGNYGAVREEAPELAAATESKRVRKAALDLRARLEPDPLAVKLLILPAVLLAFFIVWFYTHRIH